MIKNLSLVALLTVGSIFGAQAAEAVKPLKVLLVLGGCCHDYEKQQYLLSEGITSRINAEVEIVYSDDKTPKATFPIYQKADWAKGYDVVIHDECSADVKDEATLENIFNAHKDGVPMIALHCAMHSYRSVDVKPALKAGAPGAGWFDILGLQSSGHGPQKPIAISFVDKKHPITIGMDDWTTVNEELYNNVHGIEGNFENWPGAHPLAEGRQEEGDKPGQNHTVIAWTNVYGPKKTKVFATTIGHNNDTVSDARYMELVTRGLLWVTDKIDANGKPVAGYAAKAK
jgi:type 1 glutamine amidotransferase